MRHRFARSPLEDIPSFNCRDYLGDRSDVEHHTRIDPIPGYNRIQRHPE
jgi:hypothetical protein